MKGLTNKQQRVLDLLQRRVRKSGHAPSYREIASALKVDVRSAYQHVDALERKGLLERIDGRIELADDYRPPRGIPVVGRIAAGSPILATENIEDHIDILRELDDERLFFLRVQGDSMVDAGIHDGDLVLVRPQKTVANGEIAAVVVGDEATVKHVFKKRNRIQLKPANPRYKTMTFGPGDDVRIAGKVMMSLRRL